MNLNNFRAKNTNQCELSENMCENSYEIRRL